MESAWKCNVARNFESCVETYEQYAKIQAVAAQTLAGNLPDIEHPRILEIGCGTGLFTRELIEKYKTGKFFITDVSSRMVEYASNKIGSSNVRWAAMDGENIVCAERYDLIAANMVFQWFENVEKAVSRLLKNLSTEGKIFYSVPGPSCFKEWKIILDRLGLQTGMHDFKTPPGVFRQERIAVDYGTALSFLKSIKGTGARTGKNLCRPLPCNDLREACRVFDEVFDGKITWHILYGCVDRKTI